MTPTDLLEEAKNNFIVLYHKDQTVLETLLKKALGKYQDKAGVQGTALVNEGSEGIIPLPPHFLDVASCADADGLYNEWTIDRIIPAEPKLVLSVSDTTVYPLKVTFFMNLREWPENEDLPPCDVGLILDYLVALIDMPNTERERAVMLNNGQQPELPSRAELQERINVLEMVMEEARSIPVPIAVY